MVFVEFSIEESVFFLLLFFAVKLSKSVSKKKMEKLHEFLRNILKK